MLIIIDGLSSAVFAGNVLEETRKQCERVIQRYQRFLSDAAACFPKVVYCETPDARCLGISKKAEFFDSVRSGVRDMCPTRGIFVVKQSMLLDRIADYRVGERGWHSGSNPNQDCIFFLEWEMFLRRCSFM